MAMAMVVSSRDRIRSASRAATLSDRRQDAAACVSLSKSTMSKIAWPWPNPPETVRRRGRRVSIRLGSGCQSTCAPDGKASEGPKRSAKTASGAAGASPVSPSAIRLRERKLVRPRQEIKLIRTRWRRKRRLASRPNRTRLLSAQRSSCKRHERRGCGWNWLIGPHSTRVS
jgi:hypothetical protein